MKYKVYRIRQWVVCHLQRLYPWPKTEVIQGTDTVNNIPELLYKNHTHKILLITTAGTIRRGTLKKILEKMKEYNISYEIYDQVMPNPTIDCIEAATIRYREAKCQAIVAVGGGSVMDCAKIVGARIVKPSQTVTKMKGVFKIRKKLPDMYMVPTTAGTGSEITITAVVTDAQEHMKYAISDTCLVPKYAILDPALTIGLSPAMTAETGMDALTHAVEAYISLYSEKESNEKAKDAVRLIFKYLRNAYDHGEDSAAREQMLKASFEAGEAFTKAYIGYVHAIAHAVGGMYNIPHGLANACILPRVLEAYGTSVYRPLAELADVVGISGETEKVKAEAFIDQIVRMDECMGIPNKLTKLQEKDIPELARRACKEANPTYPVPDIWTEKKMEDVIRKLL